jgi:hypothetical protein
MPFRVERLNNKPIITTTWSEPADIAKEMPASWKEIDSQIGPGESEIYSITDLRELSISFSSIVSGMALQRGRMAGSASDPRIRSILVGAGVLWQVVSRAVRQVQGASIELPLFSTMEEALAHVNKKLMQ